MPSSLAQRRKNFQMKDFGNRVDMHFHTKTHKIKKLYKIEWFRGVSGGIPPMYIVVIFIIVFVLSFSSYGIISVIKKTTNETNQILFVLRDMDKKQISSQKSIDTLSLLREETEKQILKTNKLLSCVENQDELVLKTLNYNKNIYHNVIKMKISFYSMCEGNNTLLKNSRLMNDKLSELYRQNNTLLGKVDKLVSQNK